MGMKPVIASMPSDGEVWNASRIYRAALHYIIPSSIMFLWNGE